MVSTGVVPVLVCLCVFWSLSEAQERLDLYDGDICKQAGGKTWTCKPVRSCPKAIQDLRKNKRPQQCRFSSSQPVVCCEPLDSPKPPPSPKPPSLPSPKPPRFPSSSKPGSKSKQKCKEYAEYVYVKTQGFFGNEVKYDTCAIVEPLITKGKDAQSREYPHMALIGYGKRNAIEWLCGGSLISKRFVLSAGHCTDSGSKGLARWVRLGEYDVSTKSDEKQGLAQSEEYEIIERINHPYYQGPSVYNDIALYRLSREVEFNEYIRPICLHTEDQSYKDFAIATGWGRIEWGGKGSDVLQKVNLTITEADKCIEAFKLAKCPKLCNGIEESSQFCAGDLMNGGDTCQGDSGGPLQVRLTTPYCMYSQIGITSFGVKCGGNKPGVYTRVSKYISWIESIVWP